MSATKGNVSDKNSAAQQSRQQQLYKIRVLLFGCRKDLPKKTQSEYNLASTSKSSQVVDVSSRHLVTSRSDIARLPAGGALPCGCPTIPGPLVLVSESTQTVSTRDMCTQTQDSEPKSNADASTPSVACLKKDASTQSVSPNPQTKTFLQVEYQNITNRFQTPTKIVKEDDEESLSENLSQKWSFKRPVIVVNRSLAGLSASRSHEFKGDVKRKSFILVVPPKDHKQTQTDIQLPPEGPGLSQSKGQETAKEVRRRSSISFAPSTENKQTQYENQPDEKTDPLACSRISEILDRVFDLESKLRNQERSLRSLQGSIKSWKVQENRPSDCTLLFQAQPPKPCELPCKPTSVDQSTQKSDEDDSECRALSKEFIDIFIKSAPSSQNKNSCGVNSRNYVQKPIEECSLKTNCEVTNSRNELPEDSGNLQQFNRMFAKPKSQESICRTNKSEKSVPPCFAIPTVQCLKEPEPETENLLDKFVELVTKKPNDEDPGKVPSASCLAKNNAPKPSDSRQSMQKEVYESILEQFIKYFTKPKTECREKLSAPKTEGEQYSFERLCAELINLFSKPKNLESSAVKGEDKLKRVTITATDTVLGQDQKVDCQESIDKREEKSISKQLDEQDEKPCKVESIISIRGDAPVTPSSDYGNLPVLDSLVDELIYLIGPRPFRDVVLTILRRGGNVYHINVREMATGKVVGRLRANGAAINEAISLGLFEDIHTFCELDRQRADDPRDCPLGTSLDLVVPQREHGGETQLASRDTSKERASEFATRVLGLRAGETGRFFSLTNALKLARKSSDQSQGGPEVSKKTGLIGRGAVTGNLIFLGSVDDMPVTRQSQADLSELGEASKHFLSLLSGQEHEEDNV